MNDAPIGNLDFWERRCQTENQKLVIRAIVEIDKRTCGQSITVQELHYLGLKPSDLKEALCGLMRLQMIRDCYVLSGCPCIFTLNR